MTRSIHVTLAWLGMLWLLAAALTVVAFLSFIIPDYRGLTFYSVLVYICFSELILFGYIAYLFTVPQTVKRPSQAVRIRIMTMVVLWFLAILVTGIVAVRPSLADTFYSDKILFFHLLLTFLLLLGAYFIQRQDVVIQMRQDVPQRERVRFQSYSGTIQASIDCVRSVSLNKPGSVLELDDLAKRLDTLKTQLLSFSPVAERDQTRMVQPPSLNGFGEQLQALYDSTKKLSNITNENIVEEIGKIRSATDSLISSLRSREDMISL